MGFLLRPAWLALVVTVVSFAVACFTLLAPWQFGREAERDAQQHAIDVANATPAVPLAQLAPTGTGVTPDREWRRVSVTGTYLPDAQGLVRLRIEQGKPAYEVLTPIRTEDGRLLTVDRGWVPTPSGATVPPIAAPPTGPVTIQTRMRLDETDPQHRPLVTTDGWRQQPVADSRPLAAATGLALEPGYLLLAPGQPGVLEPVDVAPSAAGSAPFTNFSYALQWLTFGAIAVFALVYFVRLEMLQREGRKRTRSDLRTALAGDEDDREPQP